MNAERPDSLPCGCIPGTFMCPSAVALWDASNAAYHRYCAGTQTWDDYQQALQAYRNHFRGDHV